MLDCHRHQSDSEIESDNSNGENDNTLRENDNSREKCDNTPLTTATGKIKMYDNSKKPGTDLFNEAGSGRFLVPTICQ